MRQFIQLFTAIDQTTRINDKVAAIVDYLTHADDRSSVHGIALLIGKRPRRPLKTAELKRWAAQCAKIPQWLFEESYHIVGDLAEAIALVLPDPREALKDFYLPDVMETLSRLATLQDDDKRRVIVGFWQHLDVDGRLVFNKLITGNFRVGVSRPLVITALAVSLGMDEASIAHRLMGKWDPSIETMESLLAGAQAVRDFQPYPFYLAYPLNHPLESLGSIGEWQIEKKLDGIRGQLIVRNGKL